MLIHDAWGIMCLHHLMWQGSILNHRLHAKGQLYDKYNVRIWNVKVKKLQNYYNFKNNGFVMKSSMSLYIGILINKIMILFKYLLVFCKYD